MLQRRYNMFWAITITLICAVSLCCAQEAGVFWLDRLRLSGIYQEWGLPQAKRSVEGNPIKLKGRTFERGIGTHANSEIIIDLRRSALAFESVVGLDDEKTGEGSIVFQVWVDGRKIYDSGIMRGGDEPKEVKVDLRGAGQLMLRVTDAGDDINCDHADWADARLELDPASRESPRIFKFVDKEEPQIAESRPEEPGIHGPGIAGTTPGRPFIFLVPATGKKPLSFSAKNLPRNLVLDPVTGIITGSVEKPGTYEVEIFAQDSAKNKASRTLVIVAGQGSLCLTPPMGWNSWNIWAGDINEERVREAAESMVSTGLASHGYQYINIDDCWQGSRDEKGKIRPNAKFKDMKALADYVHGMGLRIGTYSSPGPKTCGGFEGSEGFEEKDAQTYAEWGMDYLKYDWCSCRDRDYKEPYKIMREALDKCGRDIVYSLCQYGGYDVWEWGADVGGNLWRTTGDIQASWTSMSGIGFRQDKIGDHAGPGHWNDPDMMVVGFVGAGNPRGRGPTPLSKNEQVTHVTLWCMLSAPLLLGCDLAKLDKFTIDLLTNDEVLDVSQDLLGKQAKRISVKEGTAGGFYGIEVWTKPLSDKTIAVGFFNRTPLGSEATVTWKEIGLSGAQPARDLWQRKDLGTFEDSFKCSVPAHGVVLVKIGAPK